MKEIKNSEHEILNEKDQLPIKFHQKHTRFSIIISLFFGLIFGYLFAYLLQISPDVFEHIFSYELKHLENPSNANFKNFNNLLKFNETLKNYGNDTIVKNSKKEVKILCWIMTNPSNHKLKAIHVKSTWGPHCDKLLFMSSNYDPELNSIALPVREGRNNLWAKTKEAFKYVYKNHLNDYDWFMKADDDTYMIVENLRHFLFSYSSNQPIYFGYHFDRFTKQGFMSGGAGYVLSKEAVKRFVERGLPDKTKCRQESDGPEDVEIGKCLEHVQVIVGNSTDMKGRERFFPMNPLSYYKYAALNVKMDLECFSESAISFHYIKPIQMYLLEYFIYNLKIFGS
ncbi:hypothetical protein PVAND_014467 [Polypedilum vanderplanki]|uniref:Glycoprotein-N-acetylgalactosamine 3-beta-galactosyltransferase 1 n=1 Tax=Polypedilum vanderplanki TaxID=319348 RepID=A0A9J6B9V4_POLVA|nr:hypothetical protein PVAND_014467 [Polypedilum vanderplanki]